MVEHDSNAAAPMASTSGGALLPPGPLNAMAMAPGTPPMHMMMMQMTFELSDKVTLWLSAWHIHGPWLYTASCLGLFLLCILQEALTSYRVAYARSQRSKVTRCLPLSSL